MSEKGGKIYKFGDFTFDADDLRLMRGAETLSLTQKALKTLLFLVENHRRIVTREELLEAVWQDAFVEENVLSVNISNLRKAFGENKESTFIRTVPRKGYQFVAAVELLENPENESLTTAEKIKINSPSDEKDAEILFVERSKRTEITFEKDASKNQLALPPAKINSRNRTIFYSLLSLAAVVLIFGGWIYLNQEAETKIDSIAVLPLKSIAPNETDKALGLGLADSLISRLGNLRKMTVRPLSAVNKYLETEAQPIDFARDLQVDAVLEGTFQRRENRLRVNVRLLRVADGTQIWTGIFDETETDIFKLQDSLSEQVAKSLRWNLTADERETLAKSPTTNAEAYENYLRGRYHWNKRTSDGFEKAVGFFEKAISLDAKFAEAFTGLSDAYLGFYDYGIKPADECIPQAKTAINQALQIKPDSAEALATHGSIQFLYDRNWADAEKSIRRSIEINPQYATAHLRYGWFLTINGRFEEAKRELETALEQDPTSAIIQTTIGYLATCMRNTADAERRFHQVITVNPNFSLPHWYLGEIYSMRGDRTAMFETYLKAFDLDLGKDFSPPIREIWQKQGEIEALKYWREKLETDAQKSYMPATNVALIAALQKDKDAALLWLSKAERQKDPWVLQIKYDHNYDFLRDDARFREILRQINLPQ